MIAVNGSHIKDVRLQGEAVQGVMQGGLEVWRREREYAFTSVGTTSDAIYQVGGVAMGQFLYFGGGIDGGQVRKRQTYRLNMLTGEIVPLGNLARNKYHISFVAAGDRLFCIAGFDFGYQSFNEIEEYDFVQQRWNIIVPFDSNSSDTSKPRGIISACWDGDKHIYLFGGATGSSQYLSCAAKFNIDTGELSALPSLPAPTTRVALALLVNDKIHLFGGQGTSFYALTFSLQTQAYSQPTPFPHGYTVAGYSSFLKNGCAYLFPTQATSKVLKYNPANGTFAVIGKSDKYAYGAAFGEYAGRLWIVGGNVNGQLSNAYGFFEV